VDELIEFGKKTMPLDDKDETENHVYRKREFIIPEFGRVREFMASSL